MSIQKADVSNKSNWLINDESLDCNKLKRIEQLEKYITSSLKSIHMIYFDKEWAEYDARELSYLEGIFKQVKNYIKELKKLKKEMELYG
jgi:uncharacterized protein (UPF0276 family)